MAAETNTEPTLSTPATIASRPNPRCLICGSAGETLYRELPDRLFSAPGRWTLKRCSGPACRQVWLDPLPCEDEIGKAYRDYYTHEDAYQQKPGRFARFLATVKRGYLARKYAYYPETGAGVRVLGWLADFYPGRAAELDLSVMWLHAAKRGRLLDIGSGSGWLVAHLNSLGWRAEGLDFDPYAVERARARGMTMHLGDLASQRFADASFDAVTLCHSIEHVHAPLAWLREARRILRPGGSLVLATPNNESLGHRLFGKNWLSLDPPRHLHLFNRNTLRRLLAEAGFPQVDVFTTPRDANGVYLASRSIQRTGRFDMTAPQSTLAKLVGRLAQLVESIVHRVRPGIGEDLIAIAEK